MKSISMVPYWDLESLIIYLSMGAVGFFCLYAGRPYHGKRVQIKKRSIKIAHILMFVVWEIVATFRLIAPNIGGADSIEYIEYFKTCNSSSYHFYQDTTEPLFQYITKFIRLFTADYHVYFFIIYAFIIVVYIAFFDEMYSKNMSVVPQTLVFFHFLRGFSSIRTNLASSFLLLSIILFKRDKKKSAYLIAIASVFIHRSVIAYAFFLLFYELYSKKRFQMWKMIVFILISSVLGRIGQSLIIRGAIPFLQGKFLWYASRSVETSFFSNFWKIAFSQMLLGIVMFIMNKRIMRDIESRNIKERTRLSIVRMACVYDIILIPVCYILNIWRGYEFFYVIRLLMWGECIGVIKKSNKSYQTLISCFSFVLFIVWMVFRINNTYEDTALMPYIFEPLYNIAKSF